MKNYFLEMCEHSRWANSEILNILKSTQGKPDYAMKMFSHLLSAENVWLTRLNKKDPSHLQLWPDLNPEDCETFIAENDAGYRSFISRLDEKEMLALIPYRNSKGEEFRTPVIDILTHVFLHGHYHRGQIAKALRSAGYAPANTDYIHYVRTIKGDSR